jgi:GNAT superfamily N-acetyltransferase
MSGLRQEGGVEMPEARLARAPDLAGLLDLFRRSEVSSVAEPLSQAERIWSETMAHEGVVVSEAGSTIAATCMLIIAPNLLRNGRGHAFLENVVTGLEFRGQGHGRAVVRAALGMAWAKDCHHVLMQSGRKDMRVHRFYESCGFRPGVRIGYVAVHPAKS